MILCFYWQEVESFKEKHRIIDVPLTSRHKKIKNMICGLKNLNCGILFDIP